MPLLAVLPSNAVFCCPQLPGLQSGSRARDHRGPFRRPRWAYGRLGYASWFGPVPQFDSRERAGTRQPSGPQPQLFSRRLSCHVLGSPANGSSGGDINVWGVPTLGGQPMLYLESVAEFDWSHDGSRFTYHTPGPGDPLFVSDGTRQSVGPPIFTAPAGLHSHFPSWAPDSSFIFFVQGSLPDNLDIWRIAPSGGMPQQITSHHGRVSYPIFLDRRTIMYLAGDPDASGPWLYSMDVERRIPHRLSSGLDRYTSLASSADGRRLVTLASPRRTLWRLRIPDSPAELHLFGSL